MRQDSRAYSYFETGWRARLWRGLACAAVLLTLAGPAPGEGPPNWASGVPADQELLVFLSREWEPEQFAQQHGLRLVRRLSSGAGGAVFDAGSVAAAAAFVAAPPTGAVHSFHNRPLGHVRDSFYPNDPLFFADPQTGYWGQWNLQSNALNPAAPDVRVVGAWAGGITGQGITIGIVDDSLQSNHPDLGSNFRAAASNNFGRSGARGSPDPVHPSDNHGTAVAGIAAARGGNGEGVTGLAPQAGLAGLRIDFSNPTLDQFVDATLYQGAGPDGRIDIKNHSYGLRANYTSEAAEVLAMRLSTEQGTIHVRSAGNARDTLFGDANKQQARNTPDAITVAALASSERFATYSNFGANVFVTAPSSSFREGELAIPTTDRTGVAGYNDGLGGDLPNGNYTALFGGTSAAAPQVAAALALAKQVQPELDTRFAKHLLARTSRLVDATDNSVTSNLTPGWQTNAAGYHFNQNYGFGLLDTEGLVLAATQYVGVSELEIFSTGLQSVGRLIPDGDVGGLSQTFTVPTSLPLEELLVTLDITHPRRGELEAILRSPSGTDSRLMLAALDDTASNLAWTFLSNQFWGEDGQGEWRLTVRDIQAGRVGTWNSFSVTSRHGFLIAVPEPSAFSLFASILLLAATARCRLCVRRLRGL
jgi:subtilisin family serine protease